MAMGIIGGEVQVEFNNVSTLLPFVKDGKLKALAVAEPKRMPEFPIGRRWPRPCLVSRWRLGVGLIAPAGTPRAIVDRLTAATLAVMHDESIAKQFADQYLTVMALGPDRFEALIAAIRKVGPVGQGRRHQDGGMSAD